MTGVLSSLAELIAALPGALPSTAEVSQLSDAELAEAQQALSAGRSLWDQASALTASEIARRSVHELGMTGMAQRSGFSDAARLVQSLTRSSLSEAKKLVAVGRVLAEAPTADEAVPTPTPGGWEAPLAAAVRRRLLSIDQADALRAGLGEPATDAATPDWCQAVLELIDEAQRFSLTVEELRRAASRRRALLDASATAAMERTRFEARSFRRFRRGDGMTSYTVLADPESAAVIDGAIDTALGPRTGGPRFVAEGERAHVAALEEDPRSNDQLAFDVFLAVLTTGIEADSGRLFPSTKPEVRIVVTVSELEKAVAGQPGVAYLDGHPDPVSATSALRRICSSGYRSATFDESGYALDVGRERRLFTARQRIALAVRDGGCMAPGCSRPPSQCEAHHLDPWSEGGGTSCENGILLCRFHHLQLHDTGSWITYDSGGHWLHRPGAPGAVPLHTKSGAMAELRLKSAAATAHRAATG